MDDPACVGRPLRVIVLLNAGAGTVDGESCEALASRLTSAFDRQGAVATCEIVRGTELRPAAERALARARSGETDVVAIGGGDGSLRTLAGVLADTAVPLGVLPLATLNHFAKDLGIPLDLERAVGPICGGDARAVDVAEVNGEVFVNNSSIGMYPYMVLDRDRRRSQGGWAKWPAMLLASVRSLRHFPVRRLSICVAGRTQPFRTSCLFVGNNEYVLSLPSLGTRRRVDGGELWLCVSKAESRLALLWLGLRSAFGLVDRDRDLRAVLASSAEIETRTSRLFVSFDGEVETLRPPLRYRIRPGALRVLVPAPGGS
jgi:diacylglycerol kinase family enzyme